MTAPTFLSCHGDLITAHCACVVISYPIKMAKEQSDNSLYPIAVLIDELRNDDVNVSKCVWSVWGRLEMALKPPRCRGRWFPVHCGL